LISEGDKKEKISKEVGGDDQSRTREITNSILKNKKKRKKGKGEGKTIKRHHTKRKAWRSKRTWHINDRLSP